MRESRETHLGKLCDICGDVGYAESLATCCQCNRTHEHVYCMRKNLTSVPEIWFCDTCQSSTDIVSPKSDATEHLSKIVSHKKQKTVEINRLFEDKAKVITGSPRESGAHPLPRNNYLKIVETAKVKFIPDEEAIMLTSGAKAKASAFPLMGSMGSRVGSSDTMPYKSKRTPDVYTEAHSKRFLQKENVNTSFRTSGYSKSLGSVQISATIKQEVVQTSHPLDGERSPPHFLCKPSTSERLTKMKVEEDRPGKPFSPAMEIDPSSCKVLPGKKMRYVDTEPYCSSMKNGGGKEPKYGSNDKPNDGEELGLNKAEGKEAAAAPSKEYVCKEDLVDVLIPSEETGTTNTKKKDAVSRLPSASLPFMESLSIKSSGGTFQNSIQEKDLPLFLSKFENDYQILPALNATWKGSFEILDTDSPGEFYDEFQAHPPGKVSRKAYQFSKQMPGVLQFKLQHRCDVWEEIFHTYTPVGNDIALFFFPGDFERSKQRYIRLYKLMEVRDLVMRSCFDGVELLIFTSKHLSVNLRLKMEFYLWGVFHRVKGTQVAHGPFSSSVFPTGDLHCNNVHVLVDDNKDNPVVEDMEIDMVGGDDVGRVDIPVQIPIPRGNNVRSKLQLQPQGFTSSSTLDLCKTLKESEKGARLTGSSNYVVWPPHDMISHLHPHRPNEGDRVSLSLPEVKREGCNNRDVPPGFARHVKIEASYEGLLHKPLVKVPNVMGYSDTITPRPLPAVKREHCNDLGVPPGYSRQVTGKADCEGSLQKLPVKLSTVHGNLDVPPGFSMPRKLKDLNGSSDNTDKKEKVLVEEKILSPLEKNGSLESTSKGTFQAQKKVSESLEEPLKYDQVPGQGYTTDSMAIVFKLSSEEKRSDQPRSHIPANQKDFHQRHIKDGKFRSSPNKLEVWDDSKMKATGREAESLCEMEQKIGSLGTQRPEILADGSLQGVASHSERPYPSSYKNTCLHLFPMDVKTQAKEPESDKLDVSLVVGTRWSAKNKSPGNQDASELSLSRPQYLKDGERWISILSKERFQQDGCADNVQLTL